MKNLKFYEAMEKEVNSWRATASDKKIETDYIITKEDLEIALVTICDQGGRRVKMFVYVFEEDRLLNVADLLAYCHKERGVCKLPMMDVKVESYQRKDVGTAMIIKLKTIAKAMGLNKLETDALKGSEGFYEKMGLKPKPQSEQTEFDKTMMSMKLGKI